MLSIVDLKKELGENIYIYPVHKDSIKANSIDLHVSEFAWSIKTKKSIRNGDYIIIEPDDMALVYTEESIYISHKIGGSYNSKVTLVSKGAGHIGTTLDSQYTGCSLIALHNHGPEALKLKIGSEFVTLQFWYLNSPGYENKLSHDNEPGHPRMLNGFEDVDKYIEWRDCNPWTTRNMELFHKMTQSDEYKVCKEEYEKELEKFNEQHQKEAEKLDKAQKQKRIKKYVIMIVSMVAVCAILSIVAFFVDLGGISSVCGEIFSKVACPVMVAIITANLIVDYHENK